jgi:hypothetical protein
MEGEEGQFEEKPAQGEELRKMLGKSPAEISPEPLLECRE